MTTTDPAVDAWTDATAHAPRCTIAAPLDCHMPEPAAAGAPAEPDAFDLADAIDRLLDTQGWEITHAEPDEPRGRVATLVVTDHDDPGNPKTYTVTVTPGPPEAADAGTVECDVAALAPEPQRDDDSGWSPFGTHVACPVMLAFRGEDAAGMPLEERPTGPTRRHVINEERLALARLALVDTGYFTADEIGEDVAPRITEYAAHVRECIANLAAERDVWKGQVVGIRAQQRDALSDRDAARLLAIAAWGRLARRNPAHTPERETTRLAAHHMWPEWLTDAVRAAL